MNADATTAPDAEVHSTEHEAGHTSIDHDTGLEVGHHDHGAEHLTDNKYVVIAIILAVITAAEVAASYIDLGAVFVPLLLFMMAIKFFIVVSFFMHLRFDNRLFSWMFYAGLFLAVFVYIVALLTFRVFDG
ncbi:cytochrome C oxidase subunit IV family protein [Ilumatobacter nonamiensis]|uniref:cytochrome C oxidase subunit IV family protein n=1 Tax=Ilumatobacter nonamiensis TaxID=467093 RepID=UPI0003465E5D|nr:cytochrome C oxidase subunit IV family protein [Ilumatobacter nonamiensis]